MAKKTTPAWVWIGCGCAVCIGLIFVALGGLGLATFGFVRDMVNDNADPASRDRAAAEMLGAEDLPAGFRAGVALSIPWFLEIAVLTDSPAPDESVPETFEDRVSELEQLDLRAEDFGPNTLIFLALRGRDEGELGELLEGRRSGTAHTRVDLGLELESDEVLGADRWQEGEQVLAWKAHRGHMRSQDGPTESVVEGVYAAVLARCGEGGPAKDLLWFQRREAAPEAPTPEAPTEPETAGVQPTTSQPEIAHGSPGDELAGGPADPVALRAMLAHFDFCPG